MQGKPLTIRSNRPAGTVLAMLHDMPEVKVTLVGIVVLLGLGLLVLVLPLIGTRMDEPVLLSVLAATMLLAAGVFWYHLRRVALGHATSESLLRDAFHGGVVPRLITDFEGQLVLANRAFADWLPPSGRGDVEENLAVFFSTTSPAVQSEFQRLRRAAHQGRTANADLPVRRTPSSAIEWRQVIARPLPGWVGYVQWDFEDVSERRRVERSVREEKAKLADFMAHAPVGIYSANQDGQILYANRTLADWLGRTPAELTSGKLCLHDLLAAPPTGARPYAVVAGSNGHLGGEVSLRHREGQMIPAFITQTVVASGEDEKQLRTRSVVRNLTTERQWQQALDQSEARFQHLFAEAPIGIVLLNPEMAIVETNRAFCTMLGFRDEDMSGREFQNLIGTDQQEQIIQALHNSINGAHFPHGLETILIGRRMAAVHLFATPLEPGSKPEGMRARLMNGGLVLHFIDRTEQKRMETQFVQSQKMQAIGQLAGGVAHDFNNLLTAMMGFCDLLLQRHKPGDQSFADIMQIKHNANRAANLVRQLLAFSRQQTLQPKVIDVTDVLAELSNLLRRLIGATVEMQMIHGRDLAPVRVDQGQLEQVIINLVVNSRDAMPDGGKVTIVTRNHRQDKIIVRGQDEMVPGNYVMIEVTDTGTGIAKENLERIFEPFFSTKEVGSGTGLGLSMVYGIMRQTGGFIDVESEMGHGARFRIYIPWYVDPGKSAPPLQLTDASRESSNADLTGAGTVLLVEDEDAVRVFSARALRNKGYTVHEAHSGEEALSVLERLKGDVQLLISDVVMPQMDGPTLIHKVHEKWPHLKVIFISGYTEDRFRDQLREGEIVHFLGKPFSLKQLAAKVKDVLQNAEVHPGTNTIH
ncbi:MAG: response regulator [Alphaproteobacteria bacterium]|nr:MAG: response regulator [Alphaproteobacteria bacterium]